MLREVAPELADCEPGALAAARVPELRLVVRLGEERSPGMLNFGDIPGHAGAGDHRKTHLRQPELGAGRGDAER